MANSPQRFRPIQRMPASQARQASSMAASPMRLVPSGTARPMIRRRGAMAITATSINVTPSMSRDLQGRVAALKYERDLNFDYLGLQTVPKKRRFQPLHRCVTRSAHC